MPKRPAGRRVGTWLPLLRRSSGWIQGVTLGLTLGDHATGGGWT